MDPKNAAAGDLSVAFGGANVGVAQEGLNVADIGAAFEKVGREGVTEIVDGNLFLYLGAVNGFLEDVLGGADCQMAVCGLPRKKPVLNTRKITVLVYKPGSFSRENRKAIFAALAEFDLDYPAGQINVLPPERDNFTDPQAGRVNQHEKQAMLDVFFQIEDLIYFCFAKYHWELPVVGRTGFFVDNILPYNKFIKKLYGTDSQIHRRR